MEGSRKGTYRDTFVKSFEVYQYFTSNYLPITEKVKELEMMLIVNNLPKVDPMMFNIFKILSKREKNPFVDHDIMDLKDYILRKAKDEDVEGYVEQAKSIVNYLDHLKVEKIVTPVKKVSEFLDEELIETDPGFIGSVVEAAAAADLEHKKVTNTPIKSKTAWMKIMMVVMLIGIIMAVIYIAWDAGAFDSVLKPLEGIGDINLGGIPPGGSSSDIMTKYPTPESLKAAVDRGEVKYASLPPDVQKLVDGVKTPTVEP